MQLSRQERIAHLVLQRMLIYRRRGIAYRNRAGIDGSRRKISGRLVRSRSGLHRCDMPDTGHGAADNGKLHSRS